MNAEDTRITKWVRRVKVKQNVSKRLKARQMCVDDDDDDDENAISKKPALLIAQDTQ